jgi:hypothetical protein
MTRKAYKLELVSGTYEVQLNDHTSVTLSVDGIELLIDPSKEPVFSGDLQVLKAVEIEAREISKTESNSHGEIVEPRRTCRVCGGYTVCISGGCVMTCGGWMCGNAP